MQYLANLWTSASPSPGAATDGPPSQLPTQPQSQSGASSPRSASALGARDSAAPLPSPAVVAERWTNPLSELQLLEGAHTDTVRLLCRVGDLLVSAGDDGRLVVWDSQRGARLAVLRGHTQRVTALLSLPGRLASASCDRSIRLWTLSRENGCESAAVLQTHSGAVLCLVALPGGGFVSGGSDRSVCLWNASAELEGVLARADEEPLAAALALTHPQAGVLLVCGSTSTRVQVYSLTERAWRRALPPHHRDAVQTLCQCPPAADGTAGFASGGLDGTVVLWRGTADAQLYQPVRVFNFHEPFLDASNSYLYSISRLVAVGPYIAAAIGTGFALYDSRSLACVLQQTGAHAGPLTDIAPLYEGAALLTSAADGSIKLWATRPGWNLSRDRPLSDQPAEQADEGLAGALRRAGRSRLEAVCLGEMLAHAQSVNALLPLSDNSLASCADTSLALWRDRRHSLEQRHAAVLASLRPQPTAARVSEPPPDDLSDLLADDL